MSDDFENVLRIFLSNASTSISIMERISLRHLVADVAAQRYQLNLPFQRKPQWKLSMKQKWILDILLGVEPDGLAVSRRGTINRGINGANRIRAIIGFFSNQYPIPIGNYLAWFNTIPDEHAHGRKRNIQKVLSEDARERLLEFRISATVRVGLTDAEEIKWYRDMNTNMVAHSSGQILVSELFGQECQFSENVLRVFPILKDRFNIPYDHEDDNSLGTFLAEKLGVQANPMHEDDIKEYITMTIANIFNLLVNGRTYDKGWTGAMDTTVMRGNAHIFRAIFEDLELSPQFQAELISPSDSKKRKFVPNAWICSYLLGPIAWSIGNLKPNAVATWREFLSRCNANTIFTTYQDEVNKLKDEDAVAKKYRIAWERVDALVGINAAN